MKRIAKWLALPVLVAVAGGIGYLVSYINENGPVGTGYGAKMMCSAVFVSGREPEAVMDADLAIVRSYGIGVKVDRAEKTATASALGLVKRTAVYRPGLGCTLAIGKTIEELRRESLPPAAPLPPEVARLPWPQGEMVDPEPPPEVDKEKLDQAMEWAFTEPDPQRPRRTRAVVVVHNGRIIAERYAQGFSRDTPLIGWSMTKSVTSALAGIMVRKGILDLYAPAPVPEWRDIADPRHEITLDQLLRMESGLEFHEEYETDPNADSNVMIYAVPDAGAYAASKPPVAAPDTRWSYSSGTTNIISRLIRHAVPGTQADYLAFPRRELFDRIGMKSAVLETDPSGTFMGSSNLYATARDWARFGLLYLQDGVWEGRRILPEGWVDYTRTATPAAPPNKSYGAQFWLNAGGKDRWMPLLPEDLYSARGYQGQYVTIIPSRNLVVVRLGLTVNHNTRWDHQAFLLKVLEALPG